MSHVLAQKRRHEPRDPVQGALLFFSMIAATGFAAGWAAQALGGF